MPPCVRRAHGRVSKRRDLMGRLDDMETMLKQLLVLARSPPREQPVPPSTKFAHRLLNRARHFANLPAKKTAEPNGLAQSVVQSAEGLSAHLN